MKKLAALSVIVLFLLCLVYPVLAESEVHVIEQGETAMQLAIDHDISMEQLQMVNPDVDLEMLMVGDELLLPAIGTSFDEFLTEFYSSLIQVNDIHCELGADSSAFCFMNAENRSEHPLYNISLSVSGTDAEGHSAEAEGSIPLMQLLPGESLPVFFGLEGSFSSAPEAVCLITRAEYNEASKGSFRVDPQHYSQTITILPDGSGADIAFLFDDETLASENIRKVNLLAAAYDTGGKLIGVRSMYGDLYRELHINVYSIGGSTASAQTWVEVYPQ